MTKHIVILICLSWCLIASAQAADRQCPVMYSGATRGLNCLYCMHRLAPDGALPIIKLLKKSCLKDVAISFVMDGSFGLDQNQVIQAIQQLSGNGRRLHLHLYLYNGPAQRRWQSKVFESFAVMDPYDFREKIKIDPLLRQTFTAEVEKLIPILKTAREYRVDVTLAPAVEDNLDNQGFLEAIKLIKAALPSELLPPLIRSACSDCLAGNQYDLPSGVEREKHLSNTNFDEENGIISTDGEYFVFKSDRENQQKYPGMPALDDMAAVMQKAGSLHNMFLLWVPKYQDSPPGVVPASPNNRTYRAPSKIESRELTKFLRKGLRKRVTGRRV